MEQPDYRRIHELEYELGFRDDPPPSRGFYPNPPTDAPGQIIYYKASQGRPTWPVDLDNPFSRATALKRQYESQQRLRILAAETIAKRYT